MLVTSFALLAMPPDPPLVLARTVAPLGPGNVRPVEDRRCPGWARAACGEEVRLLAEGGKVLATTPRASLEARSARPS